MKLSDNIKIIVAEPWDFTSPEGDNVFTGKIQDISKTNIGVLYLLKVSSPFYYEKTIIKWVVFTKRDNYGHVNVYSISDNFNEDVVSFSNIENILGKMSFIIVGSIKNI